MIDLTLDFHAHVLPGCDHGSDGVATSLRQLEMARAAGIRTLCATPHFYPHRERAETFLRRRAETFAALSAARTEPAPRVLLGAEVLICDGLDRLEGLSRLCLEGTRTLLVEMPFYDWPEPVRDTLWRLADREDLDIVIAHAERYDPDDIELLIREGLTLQLNAACLTHPLRRRRYLGWIEAVAVGYLGSDIHMLGPGYREWEVCRRLLLRRKLAREG